MNSDNYVFSERDEECADILVTIGMKRNIARVLVFFVTTKEATSKEIEEATGLRQPEVSLALKYLASRHWVKGRTGKSSHNGRPNMVYELTKPLGDIMDVIQKETQQNVEKRLLVLENLHRHLP